MQDWEIEREAKRIKESGTVVEETEKLFQQYNQDLNRGMKSHQSSARTLLILINEKLIYKVLREFGMNDFDNAEEYFIGKYALIAAIDKYESSKGTFSTYAYTAIRNAILGYYSEMRTQKRGGNRENISLDSFRIDLNGDIKLLDVADDYIMQDELIRRENFLEIISKCGYLTQNEQEVLMMRYGLDGSCELIACKIAERMGITKQRAGQLLNSAKQKIKLLVSSTENASDKDIKAVQRLLSRDYYLIPELEKLLNCGISI